MSEGRFAQGKTARGSGWQIHYEVKGEGPPAVLLHGGGPGATGASNYGKNLDALSKHFTCYVIDFPGWGRSSKNLEEFDGPGPFQNGGRAVVAFMDAVGISRAHLIGNSFGGASALCAALENPERVDHLVLMGPGGGVVEGATGPTEGIVQLLTYYAGDGPGLDKLGAFIKKLVYDQSLITPELLRQRYEASLDAQIMANPPLSLAVIQATPPAAIALSADPRLKDLPHRTLVVWGLQDRVNPLEGMQGFRAMPNADFYLMSRCGHWAQWEHPQAFNELIVSFIGRSAS